YQQALHLLWKRSPPAEVRPVDGPQGKMGGWQELREPASSGRRWHAVFCGPVLPRAAGQTGGERREYQLLRSLAGCAVLRHFPVFPPREDPEPPSTDLVAIHYTSRHLASL